VNGPEVLAGNHGDGDPLDNGGAQVVQVIHQVGLADRTIFLVVSDHGFKAYPDEIRTSVAHVAASIRSAAYVSPKGDKGCLYLTGTISSEAARKVIELMNSGEDIAGVTAPEDFRALSLPLPPDDPLMFDYLINAKHGCSSSGGTGGAVTAAVPQQVGSHGYFGSDPDLDAMFIASGYGIKAGAKLDEVRSNDLAPTIAKLLSLPLPTAIEKALNLE
jgi:predicted AlkP superfamily pyrophosphatase or phosphodiesterase